MIIELYMRFKMNHRTKMTELKSIKTIKKRCMLS